MLSCIWRWMQIDEWVCKQSMMRCDVWRVWMNDLWKTWSKQKDESDEYGGNKPLLMIIDQCFTMQRCIGKNWPICTRVFTKKQTWKIWIIGWMWMNLGPTSNDWREQLALTLILSPNSVTQCVVLIYLDFLDLFDFMDNFLSFTCCCTHSSCEENETNARMLCPFF